MAGSPPRNPENAGLHQGRSEARIAATVRAEQVRLFWSLSHVMIGLGPAVGLALVISQWPVVGHGVLLGWFAAVLVASAVWAAAAHHHRRQGAGGGNVARWARIGLAMALAYGILWGLAGVILFPADNFVHQAILTVMLAGISAGAVSALSPLAFAAIAFLIPALLPICYRFALTNTIDALLILSMVLMLLLALVISNRQLYATLRDNLRLRIEKADSEAARFESESRYRLMFNQSPLGVLHYDARGTIRDCNDTLVEILGSARRDIIGSSMIDDVTDDKMASAVRFSLDTGWGYYEDTYEAVKGINRVPLRAFFNAVHGPDDELLGGVAIVEDFTERKRAEEALNRQAFIDPLTELPNRRLLGDRLEQALASARRHGRFGAVVFLDIDYFKRINDWLGHADGDEVLRVIADRLTATLRSEDTVARLSGDEFMLLVPDLGDSETVVERAIETITEKVQAVLQEPMDIGGREIRLSASMGVTVFPRGESTAEALLRQSDTAMYLAKQEARGEVRFHREAMDISEDERLGLENELRRAFETEQLHLAYQPLVDADGRTVAAEALLRWHHPERGEISPERFIPVAEASGLIIALGRWVLDRVCAWLAELDADSRVHLGRVAVNVSAREFHHPDFVKRVEQILDTHGVDGHWLTFEVTENVLIDRLGATGRRMKRLKARGIRFDVDDFGTGYSALTYLQHLPVDGIKIDRGFIRGVTAETGTAAIVDAILALAGRLSLDVVAEGVETRGQLEFLTAKGCRVFQGFLWSAALPPATLLAHLDRPQEGPPEDDGV